jgi:hypothetical protein
MRQRPFPDLNRGVTDLQSVPTNAETLPKQDISEDAAAVVALRVAQLSADPNLARVVAAWPDLPDAIRRAVLALVGSANG